MARWIKGQSGNPRGRPRSGTAIAGLARSQIEKHKLIEKLGRIGACAAEYGNVDTDQQIRAIQLLLAYGYGSPRAELEGGDGIVIQVNYVERNQIAVNGAPCGAIAGGEAGETVQRGLLRAPLGQDGVREDWLIHPALQGKPVAWFAPNYRLLAEVRRELHTTLSPIIAATNQQEWRLELRGGGVIEMWSLDSPDSGRGRAYAVAVVDECALVPNLDQAWQQTIRPMLTDYLGGAWFLSTPKGMNYFKALFDRGQDPERQDWASWQMPTAANPCIDPDEIESARLDLTEAAFNQEYSAQFVNWEGSVFRRVGEAATATPKTQREPQHNYVIGCDWGRSNDYTVFVVIDITARTVVDLERSKRVDYTLQCARLKVLNEKWQPQQIIAEQNGTGQPIIEQLIREGLRIESFNTTHASKTQVIDSLALAFERGEIRIQNDPVMVGELVAFQAARLQSGLLRYSAPSGQHDDTVMALAMAWSAVSGQRRIIYPMPDSAIIVKDFPIPDHWPPAYGLDVRWLTAAAIWGALDPTSDVLYLYGEYFGAETESAVHAAAIRARGVWVPGLIDRRRPAARQWMGAD